MSNLLNQRRNRTRRITAFAVLLLLTCAWIAVIFSFSSTGGEKSSSQSQAITERVVRVVDKDYEMPEKTEPESKDRLYDNVVRKTAHVFTYTVLGVLMFLTVRSLTAQRKNNAFALKLSVPLSIIVAAADEYNQSHVEGRSGRVSDVFIDSAGIILGTALCLLLFKYSAKRKSQKA